MLKGTIESRVYQEYDGAPLTLLIVERDGPPVGKEYCALRGYQKGKEAPRVGDTVEVDPTHDVLARDGALLYFEAKFSIVERAPLSLTDRIVSFFGR